MAGSQPSTGDESSSNPVEPPENGNRPPKTDAPQSPRAGGRTTKVAKALLGGIGGIVAALVIAYFTPLAEKFGKHAAEPDYYRLNVEPNTDNFTMTVAEPDGTRLALPVGSAKFFQALSLPPPDRPPTTTYKWAHENGGVDIGFTYFQFTVTAVTAHVQIVGASVGVVRVLPETDGSCIGCVGIGAVSPTRLVIVSLDQRTVNFIPEGQPPTALAPFSFSLDPGQTETFQVEASSATCNCAWDLTLHILVDGKAKDVTVDSGNGPFITLARQRNTPLHNLYWNETAGHWDCSLFDGHAHSGQDPQPCPP
ncbi:hypothetical protein ACIRRA_42810 [Nocardia sp. NPDC101769]|uniref:hypothetical protein n=1 Tax=Nocardia sp. NPDC101769 TaxID=3364333 RepID=UPI00380CBA61